MTGVEGSFCVSYRFRWIKIVKLSKVTIIVAPISDRMANHSVNQPGMVRRSAIIFSPSAKIIFVRIT